MADLLANLDHKVDALGRLPTQFKDQPNIAALLDIINTQIQELDDTFMDVLRVLDIDNSTGAQLDLIGKLLDLRRGTGTTDTDYRQQLKGKVFVNRSDGTEVFITSAFIIITGAENFTIDELGNATVKYTIEYGDFDASLVDNISDAKALGVKMIILTYADLPTVFKLDTGAPLGDSNSLIDGTHAELGQTIEV